MSKTRKILGIVLALALVCNVMAIMASAADVAFEETPADYTATVGFGTVSNTESAYTVPVTLGTDYTGSAAGAYNVGSIQFHVTYDATKVTMTGVSVGNGYPYAANINYVADYTVDGNMKTARIIITPDTTGYGGANPLTPVELAAGTVIANLQFTLIGTTATVAIVDDAKTAENASGSLVVARVVSDNIASPNLNNQIAGQTMVVSAPVTFGAAAATPELAVIEGTAGVIDTTRTSCGSNENAITVDGYIYGVEPDNYETIDSIFEVTNDGTMEIVANAMGSECGTGTLVNVKQGDDVIATYCLIIFGDIDGSGDISALDADIAALHEVYGYGDDGQITDEAVLFAGDVDMSSDISALDGDIMSLHEVYGYTAIEGGRLLQAEVIAMLS